MNDGPTIEKSLAEARAGRMTGCRGPREPDPTLEAQDAIETGSQVAGSDDEWA